MPRDALDPTPGCPFPRETFPQPRDASDRPCAIRGTAPRAPPARERPHAAPNAGWAPTWDTAPRYRRHENSPSYWGKWRPVSPAAGCRAQSTPPRRRAAMPPPDHRIQRARAFAFRRRRPTRRLAGTRCWRRSADWTRSPPAAYPSTLETLRGYARGGAAAPYTPHHNRLPAGLDKLSPEQYRSIRFNPDAGIWRAERLPFHLELLRAGYNMQTAVAVSTIENGEAHDVVATPAMFEMESALPVQWAKVSLPLSGFRVRSRINSSKIWDEFLVFQGASYFRAVAKNLLYGLSARRLAINTADTSRGR